MPNPRSYTMIVSNSMSNNIDETLSTLQHQNYTKCLPTNIHITTTFERRIASFVINSKIDEITLVSRSYLLYVYLQVNTHHCAECPELCFNRKSLCERHIFEKHSGFGFECSMCGKIFNRPDNHGNGYDGSELVLKKRSTRTFTEQESGEHRHFMREIQQNDLYYDREADHDDT